VRLLVVFLSTVVWGQISGPARKATVRWKGADYSVTWWPILCGSQQSQDCQGAKPTRRASVLVTREGTRIGYGTRDCLSDGCKVEVPELWVRMAVEESK